MLETETSKTSNLFGGFAKNGAVAELRELEPSELVAAINATLDVWKSGAYPIEVGGGVPSFKQAAEQVLEGVNLLRGVESGSSRALASRSKMFETETNETDFAPKTKSSFAALIEANEKRHFDAQGNLVLQPGVLAAKPTDEELKQIAERYGVLLRRNSPGLKCFSSFALASLMVLRVEQGRLSRCPQ